MSTHIITVTMVIKDVHPDRAEWEAKKRLVEPLNAWFIEGPREAPYPDGSLLHWSMKHTSSQITDSSKP